MEQNDDPPTEDKFQSTGSSEQNSFSSDIVIHGPEHFKSHSDENREAEGRNFLPPPSRSSSFKINPETSREKKIVRFADALGLDLADVHTFALEEDLPNVPSSAFDDLALIEKPNNETECLRESCTFIPQFEQPGSNPYFLEKVKQEKVCLENVLIENLKVTGVVRILNIGYEKKVLALYTTNDWDTFDHQAAEYVSSDELTDTFKFTIYPRFMQPGSQMSFALKYEVNNEVFWDNNKYKNYDLKCEIKNNPQNS